MGLLYTARDFTLADASVVTNSPGVWSEIIIFTPAGKRWGFVAYQPLLLKLLVAGGGEIDINSWLRWTYFTPSATLPVQGNDFPYLPWHGQDFKEQCNDKRHPAMLVSFVKFETLDFTGLGLRRDVSALIAGAEMAMVNESVERSRERQILENKKLDLSARCFWLGQFGRLVLTLKSSSTFDPTQSGNFLSLKGCILEA